MGGMGARAGLAAPAGWACSIGGRQPFSHHKRWFAYGLTASATPQTRPGSGGRRGGGRRLPPGRTRGAGQRGRLRCSGKQYDILRTRQHTVASV